MNEQELDRWLKLNLSKYAELNEDGSCRWCIWFDDLFEMCRALLDKNYECVKKKGGLPEKDVEVLVRTVKGNNFVATIDGNENCWCVGDFFSEILSSDAVECWQYIIPPKEEA